LRSRISAYVTPTLATFIDQVAGYSGSGLQSQNITLTNTGSQALSVGQLTGTNTIIGSSATGDFVAASVTVFGNTVNGYDSCSTATIASGSSCYVTVFFVPGSTGARTGSIVFPVNLHRWHNNQPDRQPCRQKASPFSNGPVLAPGGVVFGAEVVGVTDANQQSVTLTNQENISLTVGTVTGSNYGATKDFYAGSSAMDARECS